MNGTWKVPFSFRFDLYGLCGVLFDQLMVYWESNGFCILHQSSMYRNCVRLLLCIMYHVFMYFCNQSTHRAHSIDWKFCLIYSGLYELHVLQWFQKQENTPSF
jgi:hypothetical protein